MAVLNITYAGHSKDVAELDYATNDENIKRLADEIVRSDSCWDGMCIIPYPFENYVVDRFDEQQRIYLRPKVPFGA